MTARNRRRRNQDVAKTFTTALTLTLLALPAGAFAQCANPTGDEGEMVYNATYKVMQFCNGTDWKAMSARGSSSAPADYAADYVEHDGVCYSVRTPDAPGATYSSWDDNEPNSGASENCAFMYSGFGGRWADDPCGNLFSYVCQKPLGGGCTGGYSQFNADCYQYVGGGLAWHQARSACQADGGDLVKVADSSVDTFLKTLFDANADNVWIGARDVALEGDWRWTDGTALPARTAWDDALGVCQNEGGTLAKVVDADTHAFLKTLYDETLYNVWINARDTAVEGTWAYHDGAPAPYTPWAGGEPAGGTGENHALMWDGGGGDWVDAPGSAYVFYACEKPVGAGCE